MNSGNSKTTKETTVQRLYKERFGPRSDYRIRVWEVLMEEYFQRLVHSDDTILDLGAGYGEFINLVRCKKKYAMDLNPDTRTRVSDETEVCIQDCTRPWSFKDETFDVIFTSNFLEHLPDKVALTNTLAEAKRCLKPGGHLIALGPNIRYVGGAYWDFIDHHIPLTERSLSEACIEQGLQIKRCIGKFLPYTMATGMEYPMFFIRLYIRFSWAWYFFGKQFLIIARK